MTLQQLRYFLALCEEQNFTRAAKRCGVKQPSLTRAVKDLETEFGGALFERDGRKTQLSPLGLLVKPHFAVIDRATTSAKRAAGDFFATRPDRPATQISHANFHLKESPMRKMAVSVAFASAVFLLATVILRPYRTADASPPPPPSEVVDIYKLQSTIDVRSLPQVETLWVGEE